MVIMAKDFKTEYGTLRIGETAGAVCFCYFTHGPDVSARVARELGARLVFDSTPLLEAVAVQMSEYISGRRRRFDIPVRLVGTCFRRKVWTELMKVVYGRTVTYGELAEKVGHVGSARAVGGAVGANPLFAIVPCHRVKAVNGFGGYAWGVGMKARLLQMEARGTRSSSRDD